MGPPSYMWSVVDRNVVLLRMTAELILIDYYYICVKELIV